MKKALHLVTLLFISLASQAQTFSLTVNNGYGSGSYKAGDTVHIWAKEFAANTVYDQWTGDTATVDMPAEWHTTLIMPAANVTLTANFKTVTPFSILFDSIQGKVIKKPVYYYFPQNMYGVIYCFHGSGGHASNWINSLEYRQMVNQAIADSFAVIITEADEATTGVDANSDGKLRWNTYPLDSVNNVDFANIKIITDTFINRGLMTRNTKRFSMGMSNGGAYSASCSYLFHYDAGISYCAQGLVNVFSASTVPFQFCMAKYDANDNVGPTGNASALANSNQLTARDICTRYYLHDHSPVYPERFMRISGVTALKSQAVLTDLITNNMVDANNYLTVLPDTIVARYLANTSLFPGFNALTSLQRVKIPGQLKACFADHQFYSDYNSLSLRFLKYHCDTVAALPSAIENLTPANAIGIYPNPASTELNIAVPVSNSKFEVGIFNVLGELVLRSENKTQLIISALENGVYIIQCKQEEKTWTKRFVKQ